MGRRFIPEEYDRLLADWGEVEAEDLFILMGRVQDAFGCLPRQVVEDLSRRAGVPLARVYGGLTFFPGFRLEAEDAECRPEKRES